MEQFGRTLEIGPTDNTSDQRTPRQPLRLIPEPARLSFVPYSRAQPGLRAGENDMTRDRAGPPPGTRRAD